MPNVMGPVMMSLLEKGNVRYLLIADRHDAFNMKKCNGKEWMFLPEYLDSLFKNQEQWDLYLEQGVTMSIPGKEKEPIRFLDLQKIDIRIHKEMIDEYLLSNIFDHYRSEGCFFEDKSKCKFKNVRFHFIDIRQHHFGSSCNMNADMELDYSSNLYEGLASLYFYSVWKTKDELRELMVRYCDAYFKAVDNMLICLGEPKVNSETSKSKYSKKISKLFLKSINIVEYILTQITVHMKPKRDMLINLIIERLDLTKDKALFNTEEGIMSIAIEVFGFGLWSKMMNKIQDSGYLNLANLNLISNKKLLLYPTQMVFQAQKLVMDIYAISRMTKPYNKNAIVVSGYNHYNIYYQFLITMGFKVLWKSKTVDTKCLSVPEWPIRKKKKRFGLFGGKTIKKRKQTKSKKTMKKRNF
jgi:hypothetical protein